MASSDFDIAFLTPVLTFAAQRLPDRAAERPVRTAGPPDAAAEGRRLLTDFSNWSEYVADSPPVLLIRVTPKLVEGFWTRVARGAAWTQGVSLPPFKRLATGFARMRVFCGAAEVTPIHPFLLEHRVSERDFVYEGLYVLEPDALGPHCASVKLVLYSAKAPAKGDTRVVDPKVVEQIWDDVEPYRAVGR
jgi:hypothetical protein